MENKSQETGQVNENLIAALAYLIFFLPLIVTPKSKFGRYHATQAFTLFVYFIAANLLAIIPIIGWVLMPFALIFGLVLTILGFRNAYQGKKEPLPYLGQYKILEF